MKTIFITVSDGEVSKSIFQSDIFPMLKDHARLVLFVSKKTARYFSETYGSEKVIIETLPAYPIQWIEEAFADLFLYSLHTDSIVVKIKHSFASGGSYLGKSIKLLLWNLGRFSWYKTICRFFYRILPDRSFNNYFERYHPDVVFVPNLTSNEDARLLRAAQRYGVKSIGLPKGWDNLTIKTFLPVFPDRLLVQTEEMKNDAQSIIKYPTSRISVVGFPKFDLYADNSLILSRMEFMRKFNFFPDRKLILYAGAGDQLAPYDEDILSDLLLAIKDGKIIGAPQVLLRPHPKYTYRSEILPSYPFWILDRPGKVIDSSGSSFEFDRDDVIHLMNSLYHCDLLIHTASTLGVEASIFDKPSITLAYDGHFRVPKDLSTARYYNYVHLNRVIKTSGTKVARSFEELLRYTNEYLEDPSLNRSGRKEMVARNSYILDGKAGKRVAENVIQLLGSNGSQ